MTDVDLPGLSTTVEGALAWLTIDRPDKRNAVSAAMWRALPEVLASLAENPAVKVLLVTGAGADFCAGADIGDLLSGPDVEDPMADLRRDNLAAQAALRAFPAPTIAVVRGHCIGGGLEIATCCDLRFAESGARFGVTPARIGVVYAPAAIRPLVDLVGPATAKYLLFSGELLGADVALLKGLVDEVVPPGELEARARAFAEVLASRSQLTIRSVKETVATLLAGGDPEPAAQARYRETIAAGELAEGVAAFLGKRAPRFEWHG